MPETITKVGTKVKIGTLIAVIFSGVVMAAALGYVVYKNAYLNEPILPIEKEKPIQGLDIFPVILYEPGWPRKISGIPSNIVVGDIDNDKKSEIIFGTSEHLIYALNADGSVVPDWPIEMMDYSGEAAPTINKNNDILFTAKNGVFMLNGEAKDEAGWPKLMNFNREYSPVLVDAYGDTREEILVYDENKLYLFNEDGSSVGGWPKNADGKINSIPAAGDLDMDNKSDIIYTILMDNKTILKAIKSNGEEIMKIHKDFAVSSDKVSLAVGDITDNKTIDIVLSSENGNVAAIADDGRILFNKTLQDSLGELNLGDINNDKKSEIIIGGADKLYVLNETGENINNWPRKFEYGKIRFINIADIDKDGNNEILGTTNDRIYMWKNNGEIVRDGWPLTVENEGGNLLTRPVLTDINNDGYLEILSSLSDGSVYIWRTHTNNL